MSQERREGEAGTEPPPPVLGSWERVYALVLTALLAMIVAMGWVTEHFR